MAESAYLEFDSYEHATAFLDTLEAEVKTHGLTLPSKTKHRRFAPWGPMSGRTRVVLRCSAGRLHAYHARIVTEPRGVALVIKHSPWVLGVQWVFTAGFILLWCSFWLLMVVTLVAESLRRPSAGLLLGYLALSVMAVVALRVARQVRWHLHNMCADAHGLKELHARRTQFVNESRARLRKATPGA